MKNEKKLRMNYFKTVSAYFLSTKSYPIEIECVQIRKIPYLQIIGCSASSANAMRERVLAAIASAGLRLPARKFTVQLRPCVENSAIEQLDLAVALTILGSAGLFPPDKLKNVLICGSLGLDGRILGLQTAHAIQKLLKTRNFSAAIVAWEDSQLLEEHHLKLGGGFRSLIEVIEFLRHENSVGMKKLEKNKEAGRKNHTKPTSLQDPLLQRVFTIAAAGAHHTMLLGSENGANSYLAAKFPHFLPPLKDFERENILSTYKLGGLDWDGCHPFRNPSINATESALRAKKSMPSELQLASGGILFLDSLLERPKSFLMALNKQQTELLLDVNQPLSPIILATNSLCACGESGNKQTTCICRQTDLRRYRQKLRQLAYRCFDLSVMVNRRQELRNFAELKEISPIEARNAQLLRQGKANGALLHDEIMEVKPWQSKALNLWKKNMDREESFRMARVALTISDLKANSEVQWEDYLEANHYQVKEEIY